MQLMMGDVCGRWYHPTKAIWARTVEKGRRIEVMCRMEWARVYWHQMSSFAAASPRARPPRNGHTSTPPPSHLPYVDDSMTTGNTVVRELKERFASSDSE
jgi:hypothetical protein